MKKYPCELSKVGKCEFGGNKSFNYGFMRGVHGYCRHPRKKCPLYSPLTGNPIKCPLPQNNNELETQTTNSA